MDHETKIEVLRSQGVQVPCSASLEIGDEVPLGQIQGPGTVLHSGTRLRGEGVVIGPGCRLGSEAPVTLDGCALGRDVKLHGGYFCDAVFLDRTVFGSGAHVRKGTLLEEEANAAHTVGLKQTVLLPFVTLGSLINFCDVLMAGGTSRRDHSEVGSSFIHFNFTPFGRSGDKATPSLVGDVPRGVMLRNARIFLGGQAGLVGPVEIDYGTVLAAGYVYRRDHGPDELVVGEKLIPLTIPFNPLRYGKIRNKVQRNLRYIGNLVALWHWYHRVRRLQAGGDPRLGNLYGRAMQALESGVAERVKRLGQIAGYMEDSVAQMSGVGVSREVASQRQFQADWPRLEGQLLAYQELDMVGESWHQRLLLGLEKTLQLSENKDYISIIRGLSPDAVRAGTAWMDALVSHVVGLAQWGQD